MTAIITQDEKNFISFYYDGLCNDVSRLSRLYTDKSLMTVSFENGSSSTYRDNFVNRLKLKTGKPVFKVFVSTMVSQMIDNNMLMLSIIGQFVFNDKSQKRFSHQLIVDRNEGFFYIKYETILILNEEIVYEKTDGSFSIEISSKNKSMVEVVSILESFGTVEGIEREDNSFVCKMTHLDIKIDDLKNKVAEKGFEVLS
ncbi:hypothetical protein P3W45_001566 [Vairimorpha bombi]|jgi:hypothetical protein